LQQRQFHREGMNSYMLLECDQWLDRNSYENMALEMSDIPGFMSYEIRETDGAQILYYRLKHRTVLGQIIENNRFTFDIVQEMINSIIEVIKQAQEYLLNTENIIWNKDVIFVDAGSGQLVFTYYPGKEQCKNSLREFLSELLQYIDKHDQRSYMYIMEFYNIITNPECDLEQVLHYKKEEKSMDNEAEPIDVQLQEIERTNATLRDDKPSFPIPILIMSVINIIIVCLLLFEVWTYQYVWVLIVTLFMLVAACLKCGATEEEKIDQIMEEYLKEECDNQKMITDQPDDKAVDDQYMETTVLSAIKQEVVIEDTVKELCLKSMNPRSYSDCPIDKKSIIIGSMKSNCDYYIHQKGISRMHAKIMKKEDGLYVLDMNSTNKTFLNETPLISGKEYLLEEGDVLTLAGVVMFAVARKELE